MRLGTRLAVVTPTDTAPRTTRRLTAFTAISRLPMWPLGNGSGHDRTVGKARTEQLGLVVSASGLMSVCLLQSCGPRFEPTRTLLT